MEIRFGKVADVCFEFIKAYTVIIRVLIACPRTVNYVKQKKKPLANF